MMGMRQDATSSLHQWGIDVGMLYEDGDKKLNKNPHPHSSGVFRGPHSVAVNPFGWAGHRAHLHSSQLHFTPHSLFHFTLTLSLSLNYYYLLLHLTNFKVSSN
ncbi:uncharacterized protein G2W53_031439 [Senna tora]|uniref:Uncharacterized protein n=1 Tax=Senna tora TaxID=362788 RepID=A0A834T999_9FABA|nr:uncharacterized protein G2W53_031439 [Senna tora]